MKVEVQAAGIHCFGGIQSSTSPFSVPTDHFPFSDRRFLEVVLDRFGHGPRVEMGNLLKVYPVPLPSSHVFHPIKTYHLICFICPLFFPSLTKVFFCSTFYLIFMDFYIMGSYLYILI